MLESEIQALADAAVAKYEMSKNHVLKYLLSAAMAGAYLVVAVILSNVTAGLFHQDAPLVGKLLASFFFPLAIILIVFFNTDLFTGCNVIMAIGVYQKKCNWLQLSRVWVISFVGNFIGCVSFVFLFVKSGASVHYVSEYISSILMNKLQLSATELITRGILCNFCVCFAVLAYTRMKTESGKLIIMFFVIATFVLAGFEHCVANMAYFSIAYLTLDQLPPIGLVLHNMLFVTIGNMLGGALFLGLPVTLLAKKDK